MHDVLATQDGKICLGRLGENEHTRVVFDISDFIAELPGAIYTLLNRVPGQPNAYAVANTEVDGSKLYWVVSNSDLTQKGIGQCELVVSLGTVIVKSIVYMTEVLEALDDSGAAPDPWESWLTVFQGYVNDASEYASNANDSATAAAASAGAAAQRAYGLSISGSTLTFTLPSE